MRIKKLFIRDFGIFNNQQIDEIGPGLVIIGGLNRAGKTTFLQLLRYIAFGFPRKKDFIPAREKHEVEAVVAMDNNKEVSIHLQGYAEPLISMLQGNKEVASAGDLYNSLDPFTYQQLFTITLDELQSNKKNGIDKERLQSILLGAGLQEFVLLPQLEDYFNNQAEKIGGKNGDPKVRDFKPYTMQIEEGLNIRNQASRQVEKFKQKKEELKDINHQIEEYDKQKDELEKEINRLDILKNNYKNYSKIIELESKLNTDEAKMFLNRDFYPEKAKDILERYNKKEAQVSKNNLYLKNKLGLDNLTLFKQKCLKYKDKIALIKQKLSGLKERIRYYHETERNIVQEEDDLRTFLNKVNEDWNGNIAKLHNIKSDQIELVSLQRFIDRYKKLSGALENEKERLQEYQERKTYLEESIDTLEVRDPKKTLRFYFLSSFGCILLGFALSFIHIYLSAIGLAGFLGLVIYLFYKYSLEKGYLTYREKSFSELNNLDHQIENSQKKLKSYRKLIDPLNKELNQYRISLGLAKDAPPELIKDYFREIQQCKEKLNNIEQKKEQLDVDYQKIDKDLKELVEILKEFPEALSLEKIDGEIELDLQDDILFSMLDQMLEYTESISNLSTHENELAEIENELKSLYSISDMELADIKKGIPIYIEEYLEYSRRKQMFQALFAQKEQLVQQIKAVLNTELVRNAMKDYPVKSESEGEKSLDNLYESFSYLYDRYLSLESVESKYYNSREQLDALVTEKKKTGEIKQSLKKELADLATDDELRRGSILIDQARQELSYLAEEYAVNKTASYVLKKVRETFIQQTKDKLLAGASQYFRRITGGEYKAILPTDKIMQGDFQALLKDGTVQTSTEFLSRGTNEQLFLAIRISRIKEIKPALPVIVDDSLVNFDSYHLVESLELLKELARTHQVFILTCHPNIIEACDDNLPVQYWKLETGQFSQSNKDELYNYLKMN
ncbi:MAG: AAA family ATPase [Halanaerobiales bacterium]